MAVSGHRPDKLGSYKLPNPIYNKVCQETQRLFLELKPEKVLTGMAIGYDQYVANICIRLNIPFVAVIPFVGQEKMWPADSQVIYKKLLAKSAEQVVVSEGGYAAFKMQVRNQYMADNCDEMVICWDGSNGGTKNCYDYAISINRRIYRVNPKEL